MYNSAFFSQNTNFFPMHFIGVKFYCGQKILLARIKMQKMMIFFAE
jgi:hypothetical protein